MLLHCVFLNFRSDTDIDEQDSVLLALGALKDEVPGMLAYEHGPNRDFENKSADYSSGFVIRFRDRAAHLEYERHPKHVALGSRLVEMCEGGADGILVFVEAWLLLLGLNRCIPRGCVLWWV